MGFLETVDIECDECEGKRYKSEVLEHRYNSKNIHEVLQLTASDALEFFKDKKILRRLRVLNEVGLGYITLGQTVSSLSGGEAQRLKLARELNKRGNVYILDEPTTGLHMADIEKLLLVVNRLVDQGNTVIVIEHNLDVIKNADWVIDMGPEGGNKGGFIIAEGTPEQIAENPDSSTGEYLSKVLLA
jgi:excinuclease UvrABC ATPase subunit